MNRVITLVASAALSVFVLGGLAGAEPSLSQPEPEPQGSRCYGSKPVCPGSPEPCCVCPSGSSDCEWACCR